VATSSRLLQFKVSFAKEPYTRGDILQKRPVILRSLLIVGAPSRTTEAIKLRVVQYVTAQRLASRALEK